MKKGIYFILFLAGMILFSIFVSAQETQDYRSKDITEQKFERVTYEVDSAVRVHDNIKEYLKDSFNVVYSDTILLIHLVNVTQGKTLDIKLGAIVATEEKTILFNGDTVECISAAFDCTIGEDKEYYTILIRKTGEILAVGIIGQYHQMFFKLKKKPKK